MAMLQGADIFEHLAAKDRQRVINIILRTFIETDYAVFYKYVRSVTFRSVCSTSLRHCHIYVLANGSGT